MSDGTLHRNRKAQGALTTFPKSTCIRHRTFHIQDILKFRNNLPILDKINPGNPFVLLNICTKFKICSEHFFFSSQYLNASIDSRRICLKTQKMHEVGR